MSQNNKIIKFEVLGKPNSQARHRTRGINKKGGGVVNIQYDPSQKDKKNFLLIAQEFAPEKPFDEPLRVDITAFFPRPKNHYRTGKYSHELKDNAPKYVTTKPDKDNITKFVLDSLNSVFWSDDKVVCEGDTKKYYSDKPRIIIVIYRLKLIYGHN